MRKHYDKASFRERWFQQVTIRIFEKSGHTPSLEEPELFDQVLLEWLSTER